MVFVNEPRQIDDANNRESDGRRKKKTLFTGAGKCDEPGKNGCAKRHKRREFDESRYAEDDAKGNQIFPAFPRIFGRTFSPRRPYKKGSTAEDERLREKFIG